MIENGGKGGGRGSEGGREGTERLRMREMDTVRGQGRRRMDGEKTSEER